MTCWESVHVCHHDTDGQDSAMLVTHPVPAGPHPALTQLGITPTGRVRLCHRAANSAVELIGAGPGGVPANAGILTAEVAAAGGGAR